MGKGRSRAAGDLFVETIPIAETRQYVRKILVSSVMYAFLYHDADRVRPRSNFSCSSRRPWNRRLSLRARPRRDRVGPTLIHAAPTAQARRQPTTPPLFPRIATLNSCLGQRPSHRESGCFRLCTRSRSPPGKPRRSLPASSSAPHRSIACTGRRWRRVSRP